MPERGVVLRLWTPGAGGETGLAAAAVEKELQAPTRIAGTNVFRYYLTGDFVAGGADSSLWAGLAASRPGRIL